MLDELQRRACLQAMGITCYVPRLRLPGAKPSPLCEMPIPPEPAEAPALQSAPETVPGKGASTAHQLLKDMELPRRESRSAVQSMAGSEEAGAKARAAVPRIALTVARTETLLIVDEAPAGGADPADYLQLLQNLLFALGGRTESLVVDAFVWPVAAARSAHVDQSAAAARQALQAFIGKRLGDGQVLLLMGEAPRHYLSAPGQPQGVIHPHADLPVSSLCTVSASRALAEPALKAVIWRDLAALSTTLRAH